MKKLNFVSLITTFVFIIGISFTSCTKNKINEGNSDTSTLQQLSKDQSDVQSADDDGLNDANNILTPGTTKGHWSPPHANLDTTISGDTTIYTVTYNGANVWNRGRTGKIIIKRITTTLWYQQGATVWVTFVNYKVTKLSTNKSVTFNGTKTFVNVSGGYVFNLGFGVSQVIHQVTGSLKITFDDSTSRTWNFARRRTFTGSWLNLVLTTDGFGAPTGSGYSNLESWGTNRNGELFYSKVKQPVVYKLITCGFNPSAGSIEYFVPADNKTATITFGFDSNNQPIPSSSNNCPEKYKLEWTKNGNSGTVYLPIL